MFEEIAELALDILKKRKGFEIIDDLLYNDVDIYNEIVDELSKMFREEFNKEIF